MQLNNWLTRHTQTLSELCWLRFSLREHPVVGALVILEGDREVACVGSACVISGARC